MKKLDEIRKDINEIDKELVRLFEKRMGIVGEIAENKIETGKAVYDSKREQEVIKRALNYSDNKSFTNYTKEFFEQLMDISKKYQYSLLPIQKKTIVNTNKKGLSVGFQGVSGSFSDSAVDYLYDQNIIRRNYKSFEQLFIAVLKGEIEEGVVPYENTSTGGVYDVLDLLRKYDLFIVAQFDVTINHCLLGVSGSTLDDIKMVYSHPQALLQCSKFLNNNKEILEYPYANTAIAAKDIAIWGEKYKGAIASKKAANLYNLKILIENLQDNSLNTTRFIVVKNKLEIKGNASKTSIIFTSAHVPGALYNILKSFYLNNINITRIESRPNINRKFEYYFYLDFLGTVNDKSVINAISDAKKNCGYFKILGSYSVKGEK